MILIKTTPLDRELLKGLSIDPSEIADDGTNWEGIRVKKPWGHEVEKYKDGKVAVWWLHIHSNQETSMHCHPGKTTMLMIVGGLAIISTLSSKHEVDDGGLVVIEPGAFHKIASAGGPVVLYEIESPANKRDLVRLEDRYGRGQGYEVADARA